MNKVTGIDPGSEQTAVVVLDFDSSKICFKEIISNETFIKMLEQNLYPPLQYTNVAIEKIASYGMAVGETVFQTVRWYGRFEQEIRRLTGNEVQYISRNEIKNNLCHSSKAKDANIRQAIIDRYGPPGTKKNQGVTYGVSKDIWAALAVAITYAEGIKSGKFKV